MLKKIYIYLVLFATLMMTIGGSVSIFMSVADLIAPNDYHQTFEEYKRMGNEFHIKDPNDENKQGLEITSDEELRLEYNEMLDERRDRMKKRIINNIIKSLGWIVIPLPVFIYFGKESKEEK